MSEECLHVDILSDDVVPTVWLLIDGSDGMSEPLSSQPEALTPSRWEALRETLMDRSTGVVAQLAQHVRFGLMLYDGLRGGECPRLITREPERGAFDALDVAFPSLPLGGFAPTHEALAYLASQQHGVAAFGSSPTYVVFATGSQPNDFCGMNGSAGADVQREVVSLARRMAKEGTPMYVISLAAGNEKLTKHLTAVAEAGGTERFFAPSSEDRLVEALHEILGPDLRCTVRLPSPHGKDITMCQALAKLNGETLECDGANGWKLRDSTTLELRGRACEAFKTKGAHLEAFFPCPAVIP